MGGCTRTKFTWVDVHVGEGADEGEEDTKADGEARAQGRVLHMHRPSRERRAAGVSGALHATLLIYGEIDERGAKQVEAREEVEVRGEAEMFGDTSRDDSADEIARLVAGDVGGKCGRRVGGAVMLAEISERDISALV
jgi:hypothetical protein